MMSELTKEDFCAVGKARWTRRNSKRIIVSWIACLVAFLLLLLLHFLIGVLFGVICYFVYMFKFYPMAKKEGDALFEEWEGCKC